MAEIVSLDQKRLENSPHLSGHAHCVHCGHKWVAVAPVGTRELECPECHTIKGAFTGGCEPEIGWTCNCGCYLFTISPKGVICWECGQYQTGFQEGLQ